MRRGLSEHRNGIFVLGQPRFDRFAVVDSKIVHRDHGLLKAMQGFCQSTLSDLPESLGPKARIFLTARTAHCSGDS